ncbi:hypothetical protein EB796_008841 [Bugula neritina]|uniref:Uncharacterized protein n=1 Tax=Bugula neritina TaxID=10212 RepID=A0A7J7K3R1_BUGNE|nr:hypothetical protein EB796_008841 [Bugula neritina]
MNHGVKVNLGFGVCFSCATQRNNDSLDFRSLNQSGVFGRCKDGEQINCYGHFWHLGDYFHHHSDIPLL